MYLSHVVRLVTVKRYWGQIRRVMVKQMSGPSLNTRMREMERKQEKERDCERQTGGGKETDTGREEKRNFDEFELNRLVNHPRMKDTTKQAPTGA